MLIRDLIHARLESLGWSQSDLSRASGIARQNLSLMLRGERPLRVEHLQIFDNILHLGIDFNVCTLPDAATMF